MSGAVEEAGGHAGHSTWVGLGALVVFGALIRSVPLGHYPLAMDELVTVDEATALFDRSKLFTGIEARPLYFLLQHPLLGWLPHDPIWIRLLPTLFGVLGIWATFMLGRRVGGVVGGLVSATLVTVSPLHLFASSFARYWSLIYLMVTLSVWGVVCVLDRPTVRTYAWSAVAIVTGGFVHPAYALPMVGVVLARVLDVSTGAIRLDWPPRREWMRLWLPVVAIVCAWALALIVTHTADAGYNGAPRDALSIGRILPAFVEWAGPTICVAGMAGILAALRLGTTVERRQALVLGLGLTTGLALLLAAAMVTDAYALYAIASLPFFVVGAGLLASRIAARGAGWLGGAAVAGLLVMAGLPSTVSFFLDGTRWNYEPAYAKIMADAPNDLVLMYPTMMQRHYAPTLRAKEFPAEPDLDAALERERSLWAVVTRQRYGIVLDNDGRVGDFVARRCRLVQTTERPRFDYRTYRVELFRCATQTGAPS